MRQSLLVIRETRRLQRCVLTALGKLGEDFATESG